MKREYLRFGLSWAQTLGFSPTTLTLRESWRLFVPESQSPPDRWKVGLLGLQHQANSCSFSRQRSRNSRKLLPDFGQTLYGGFRFWTTTPRSCVLPPPPFEFMTQPHPALPWAQKTLPVH